MQMITYAGEDAFMSYFCPVCNGLQALETVCPQCGATAEDSGRLNDYLGPYSPYGAIDETGMANGLMDVSQHICVHAVYCSACGSLFHRFIPEWTG